MGRGAVKNAETNTGIGREFSHNLMDRGQALWQDTLQPTLTNEATNPQGFAPNDLAAMNTAAMGAAGGANASAAGQGALTAARTRNAGAANPALEESARDAMRQQAQSATQIQGANALQRESNRQAGITGLGRLYDTNTSAALNALGLSNNAVGQWTNASQQTTDALLGAGKLGLEGIQTGLKAGNVGGFCWVAASFWGWDDVRTHIVRNWMLHDSPSWFRWVYLKFGEFIAKTPMRWLYRPIFELVLRRAK